MKAEETKLAEQIEARINAEYRKHKSLDWAKIASIKIAHMFAEAMPTEEEINNSNPYPEDVFLPISDETLKKVADYLKWGGYSPDALFGHWGRIVWNNCCKWFRNRMGGKEK